MPVNYAICEQDFWQFSGEIYAEHKTFFLHAQDTLQANVNLLLLCCFAGIKHIEFSAQNVKELEQSIASSHEALCHHRQKRKSAKGQAHYSELLAQELEMERTQQALLIAQLKQCKQSVQGEYTQQNLLTYQQGLNQFQKDVNSITAQCLSYKNANKPCASS